MRGRILAASMGTLILLAFCGCQGSTSQVAPTGELSLTNFVFCAEEPRDHMQYTEQPGAKYQPGDTVWIYVNLSNHQYYKNADGSNEMWLTEYLVVKGPEGEVLVDQEVLNEHRNFADNLDPRKIFFTNYIETNAESLEGTYTVEITAEDKLSNKTTSASSNFTLKK